MRRNAINDFLKVNLTKEEMENIFIPEKRRVCQTCKKVRIKKKIDKNKLKTEHKRYICEGNCRRNNGDQQNQADNLNQNDNNQEDNNNLNNIGQDNFAAPDNNDDIINNNIPDIQDGNNDHQPNNQGPNIGNYQNQI